MTMIQEGSKVSSEDLCNLIDDMQTILEDIKCELQSEDKDEFELEYLKDVLLNAYKKIEDREKWDIDLLLWNFQRKLH